MALGKRVKEARKIARVTQNELAEKIGVSQSTIGTMEAKDAVRSVYAAQIAQALEVDLLWLTTGEGAPQHVDKARERFHRDPSLYDAGTFGFNDGIRERKPASVIREEAKAKAAVDQMKVRVSKLEGSNEWQTRVIYPTPDDFLNAAICEAHRCDACTIQEAICQLSQILLDRIPDPDFA